MPKSRKSKGPRWAPVLTWTLGAALFVLFVRGAAAEMPMEHGQLLEERWEYVGKSSPRVLELMDSAWRAGDEVYEAFDRTGEAHWYRRAMAV